MTSRHKPVPRISWKHSYAEKLPLKSEVSVAWKQGSQHMPGSPYAAASSKAKARRKGRMESIPRTTHPSSRISVAPRDLAEPELIIASTCVSTIVGAGEDKPWVCGFL